MSRSLGLFNLPAVTNLDGWRQLDLKNLGQRTLRLNVNFSSTNTKMYESAAKGEPYDHVFHFATSTEDVVSNSFQIVDLMAALRSFQSVISFPLEPYVHDTFRTAFSDHVPVSFKLISGKDTDR